jgi:hypothetical protein
MIRTVSHDGSEAVRVDRRRCLATPLQVGEREEPGFPRPIGPINARVAGPSRRGMGVNGELSYLQLGAAWVDCGGDRRLAGQDRSPLTQHRRSSPVPRVRSSAVTRKIRALGESQFFLARSIRSEASGLCARHSATPTSSSLGKADSAARTFERFVNEKAASGREPARSGHDITLPTTRPIARQFGFVKLTAPDSAPHDGERRIASIAFNE